MSTHIKALHTNGNVSASELAGGDPEARATARVAAAVVAVAGVAESAGRGGTAPDASWACCGVVVVGRADDSDVGGECSGGGDVIIIGSGGGTSCTGGGGGGVMSGGGLLS